MRIPEREHVGGYHEVKEHGGREFPFNIYLCSIPLDFRQMPVHWHEEMEIVSVKKGLGTVTVDTEAYEVEEGEMIVIFPGQLHGISQLGDQRMEYENIIFRPDMLMMPGEDMCTQRFLLPLIRETAGTPFLVKKETPGYPEMEECIRRLDALSGERGYGYEMAVKGMLFWLFYEICRNWSPSEGERPQKSRERMKGLLSFIEEHYGDPLTVEQAAGLCCYSKSHFMKYFKQYMGVPFIRYLNDYRLSKAGGYLKATKDPVTAVALRCGFENLSYFNRLFRRKYGMTPADYRNREGH